MRIALIINKDSGAAGELDIEELLAAAGHEVQTFDIEDAESASGSNAERVVVAGGDGSLALAAEQAVALDVPLAVIPAGTANDFAVRMGIPEDIEEAARLAADGKSSRRVDIAALGDRSFLNVASLGLAPAAAEAAHDLRRSWARSPTRSGHYAPAPRSSRFPPASCATDRRSSTARPGRSR
jgi:diacylglycerol kinase (ATP)